VNFEKLETVREGEPCLHPGCLQHITHPCEVCHRVGGRGVAVYDIALEEESGSANYSTQQIKDKNCAEIIEQLKKAISLLNRWMDNPDEDLLLHNTDQFVREAMFASENCSPAKERNYKMQNYTEHASESFYGIPRIKIFCGTPEKVEKEVTDFVNSVPMDIEEINQSESASGSLNEYSITISILYSTAEPKRFIMDEMAEGQFSEIFMNYIEKHYNLSFDNIIELIINESMRRKNERTQTFTKEI